MDCAETGDIPDVLLPTEDFQRPKNETPKVNHPLLFKHFPFIFSKKRVNRPLKLHLKLLKPLTKSALKNINGHLNFALNKGLFLKWRLTVGKNKKLNKQ